MQMLENWAVPLISTLGDVVNLPRNTRRHEGGISMEVNGVATLESGFEGSSQQSLQGARCGKWLKQPHDLAVVVKNRLYNPNMVCPNGTKD